MGFVPSASKGFFYQRKERERGRLRKRRGSTLRLCIFRLLIKSLDPHLVQAWAPSFVDLLGNVSSCLPYGMEKRIEFQTHDLYDYTDEWTDATHDLYDS